MHHDLRTALLVPFLCLALGLLGGCGKGDKGGGTTTPPPTTTTTTTAKAGVNGTIGVSLYTLANPFFKEMGDAIAAEAAAKGYAVRVVSADRDPARQRDQVRDFLTAGVVAIILTPADSKAVGTAIRDANEKRVPVFTADIANLDPTAKVVCHVATDNYAGGRQAGEALVEAVGGTAGRVAILEQTEVESGALRGQGVEEVVARHPGVTVVAKLPCDGERDRSFRSTQDILQAHPDVQAIFAVNDPAALGAVAALEGAGKLAQVKVIGFDGQPEAKRAIRDGKMYADAVQYPARIGALVVDQVAKYLGGEAVEPKLLIPTAVYRQADAVAEFGPAAGH